MGRLVPQQAADGGEGPPTIHHLSHAHLLRRVYCPDGAAWCDGCRYYCGGVVYSCDPCNYVLHKACATTPPALSFAGHVHVLAFTVRPPYIDGRFTCNACGEAGKGFCYRCSACGFDLYVHCAPTSALNPQPWTPTVQGYTAAAAETTRGLTPSSPASMSTGMTGVQKGVAGLEAAAAGASLVRNGIQIQKIVYDDHQQQRTAAGSTEQDASTTDDDCDKCIEDCVEECLCNCLCSLFCG